MKLGANRFAMHVRTRWEAYFSFPLYFYKEEHNSRFPRVLFTVYLIVGFRHILAAVFLAVLPDQLWPRFRRYPLVPYHAPMALLVPALLPMPSLTVSDRWGVRTIAVKL